MSRDAVPKSRRDELTPSRARRARTSSWVRAAFWAAYSPRYRDDIPRKSQLADLSASRSRAQRAAQVTAGDVRGDIELAGGVLAGVSLRAGRCTSASSERGAVPPREGDGEAAGASGSPPDRGHTPEPPTASKDSLPLGIRPTVVPLDQRGHLTANRAGGKRRRRPLVQCGPPPRESAPGLTLTSTIPSTFPMAAPTSAALARRTSRSDRRAARPVTRSPVSTLDALAQIVSTSR